MAVYEITAENYTVLKSDNNIKNKISQVNGTARSQTWAAENLIGGMDEWINYPSASYPEVTTPQLSLGNGYVSGAHAELKRGEVYYLRGQKLIRFETPIDFVKAFAKVTYRGSYYERGGTAMWDQSNDSDVGNGQRSLIDTGPGGGI